jgi:hypothetical protein
MPSSIQTIKDCIKSTEENIERAKKSFSHLSDIQLNWKPDPESWSVGECLSHLVNSNSLYLDKIANILNSFPTNYEKDFTYKQSFMGKLISEGVDPANLKKAKTFKVFFPDKSAVQNKIIDEYVKSSEKLIELAGKMEHLDLEKIKLSSPVNIMIRLNLGDPLIIIPKHDKRHLNQAEKVMNLKEFPIR